MPALPDASMIQVQKLVKRFGTKTVLNGLSIQVRAGEPIDLNVDQSRQHPPVRRDGTLGKLADPRDALTIELHLDRHTPNGFAPDQRR